MKNNQRNLLFLLLTFITFFASLAIYLSIDKNTREESLWMGLMITAGVLVFGFICLLGYDFFSGSEEKYDQESRKAVLGERYKAKTLIEQNLLKEEEVGKHVMHTHYAFENLRNSLRSIFIAIVHIFVFSVLVAFFIKKGTDTESIIALVFGVLALAVHVGFLLYNLYAEYYLKEYREPIELIRSRKNIVN